MKKYLSVISRGIVFASIFLLAGCSVSDVAPFLDSLTKAVGGWGAFSVIIAGGLEFLLRVFPSVNPKSLFLLLSGIGHALGHFFEGVSTFLDSLGLQNAKSLK